MKQSAEEQVEKALIQGIFGGAYRTGAYLPPERKLVDLLGFSRPVIHKAIIRLENKGLVTIVPRQGIRVNDYRESGKLELLEALYEMYRWKIDISMHRSILEFVKHNLTQVLEEAQIKRASMYDKERSFTDENDLFLWMQAYAMASENVVYAMLFNEFKTGIVNVHKFLLAENHLSYQNILMEIDEAIQIGERQKLQEQIRALFDFIETHWIRRCEDEAESSNEILC